MRHYKKASYLIIIIGLLFAGCVKDNTLTTYTGPDLVEFAPTVTRIVTTTATPKKDSILVQLVGKQRSTPTNVTFSINSSSTAIAGTDYTIQSISPLVIQPNTSSVFLYLTENKVISPKTLVLDLTGGDNVTPSENYRTFTFTLK